MANRSAHAMVGALVGGAAAVSRVPRSETSQCTAETIGGIVGGWIGGVLPDVFEPATTPNHRQLAHSALAGGGLALARIAEWQAACRTSASAASQRAVLLPVGSRERDDAETTAILWRVFAGLLIGFVIGYASHLALDACTPRGLPLVGRIGGDRK